MSFGTNSYIYDAVRTPRGTGNSGGALSGLRPEDLVKTLVDGLGTRSGFSLKDQISSLTLGCVGQVGAQGGHLALQARVHAGLSDHVRPLTVNNFCVSSLTAIRLASLDSDEGLHLAGGVEMMSAVPFLADCAPYYSNLDQAAALSWVPVGLTADLMANRDNISRDALDQAALRSHNKAAGAWSNESITEVVPVKTAQNTVILDRDETVRPNMSMDRLAKLLPVFAETGHAGFRQILIDQCPDLSSFDHIHTLAHCPPIADGASLALIGSKRAGHRVNLDPKAQIRALVDVSGDRLAQLSTGFLAMERLLQQTGLSLHDFDRIEFMEAFAASIVKFERDYDVDIKKVNCDGGHLALGHPMGASGAMLVASLIGGLERCDGTLGLIVASGGSGAGVAMVIERL